MHPNEEAVTMEVGQQLPWVDDVADDNGRSLNWRDTRRTRVVVFAHPPGCPDCGRYARALLARREELARAEADVWFVGVPGDAREETGRVAIVTGETAARLRRRCGLPVDQAWLIVADRWGQVWRADPADRDHSLPDPDDVVETAWFIGVQCPECETIDQPTVDWSRVH